MLTFKPTYVKVGPLVVKVCRDREWYKVESGQKPESEDKDEQVENPTNETSLENFKELPSNLKINWKSCKIFIKI